MFVTALRNMLCSMTEGHLETSANAREAQLSFKEGVMGSSLRSKDISFMLVSSALIGERHAANALAAS